jgi:Rrf2 family protein
MKISAKIDYACKALLELAKHWPKPVPVAIRSIARNQRIPIKFLTHILIQLKTMGLVESTRGQRGGYILMKSPKDISLGDIVGGFSEVCFTSRAPKSKSKADSVLDGVWQEAEEAFLTYIGRVTFEDILSRERKQGNVPMYTI